MRTPKGTFENHSQWTSVKEVTSRLKLAGYEAYLAGGCVRDLLMGREPNDFDIATNATPDQIEGLFPKSIAVGKAFGVIILPYLDFQLEVATFREDLEYRDGRRPEGVKFSTPQADAQRRDFTINALFYDLDRDLVIDYVGGEADIVKRVIQTVGEPDLRFNEDKLRILRAVRFAGQLDFEIEAQTLKAIHERATEVAAVSRERIRDEVQKLLKSPARGRGLKLLISTGLFAILFPEIKMTEFWLPLFEEQSRLGKLDPEVSLTLFLLPYLQNDVGAKEKRETLQRLLKLDNRLLESILFTARNLEKILAPNSYRRGEVALLLAKSKTLAAVAQIFAKVSGQAFDQAALEKIKREVLGPNGEAPVAFVSGADVLQLGVKPGPKVGEIVSEAYLLQLESKFASKEAALAWCRNQLQS